MNYNNNNNDLTRGSIDVIKLQSIQKIIHLTKYNITTSVNYKK